MRASSKIIQKMKEDIVMIRALANLIWFILGGLVLGLLWSVAGLLLCISIIGIPLGVQCFIQIPCCKMQQGIRIKH